MTPEAALAALVERQDAIRAEGSAAYHKAPRRYLGVSVPDLTEMVKSWRADLDVPGRVTLADALWRSDIHEARIAAAKLLTQAGIKEDEAVWRLIASWVPEFDAWAIADHACDAGERRLVAHPSRIDEVERWTHSGQMWTRRAALVITLPWTKQNHPSAQDLAIRDRVLGWAAVYADDRNWFIQKAIAWWLRDLSKHDEPRVRDWLAAHGSRLKPFARKIAAKYVSTGAA
ncbi:MAG: DNA alkylation repair protein [Rhodobacteraceae bacterium]|nr:DNA alkylation repair protein [Paracoccaceae bacterium]